jgi:hypothetical protein
MTVAPKNLSNFAGKSGMQGHRDKNTGGNTPFVDIERRT